MSSPSEQPIRIGIAGTGYGARVALPVYLSLPEFEPVAVWSRRGGRAAEVAEKAGVGCATADLDELLDSGVEAVHVATPVFMHAGVAQAAAERGLHVLCEKPPASDLDEAARLARAVEQAGVVCMVNLSRRFQEARRRLLAAAAEVVGAVRFAQISLVHDDHATSASRAYSWVSDARLGGGRLQAYGVHDLDLVLQACGPVTSVAAAMDVGVTARSDGADTRRVTAEDSYALLLRLECGGLAVVTLTATARHRRGDLVEIHGERGSVRLDAERRLWQGLAGEELRCTEPLAADSAQAFAEVARSFHAAVRFGRAAEPSLEYGLRVQALMDAARLAASERRWVDVCDPAAAR